MPVTRILQETDSDCLPCCIAMVLDLTREEVLLWFEGREHNRVDVMWEVLKARGYDVEEFEAPGQVGGTRRILALNNQEHPEMGHAVVMDDNETIVDPKVKTTTRPIYLLEYSNTKYRCERVFLISKKAETSAR